MKPTRLLFAAGILAGLLGSPASAAEVDAPASSPGPQPESTRPAPERGPDSAAPSRQAAPGQPPPSAAAAAPASASTPPASTSTPQANVPAADAREPKAEPPASKAAPSAAPPHNAAADAPAANASAPDASAPSATAPAATAARAGRDLTVQVAPKSADDRTVRKFAGQEVRGNDGRVLGKIQDLLVDPASSQIEYAVISYGGLFGIGDRLRLVPFAALHRSGSPDEFTLPATTAQWEQLPHFESARLKESNLAISDGERRRLAGQLADGTPERSAGAADEPGNYYTAALTQHLVPAKQLEDRSVYTDRTKIGKVEAIVIDETARTALALFDPEPDFSPSAAKFLVPLHQLRVSGRAERLTSSLTREDLDQTSRMAANPAMGAPKAGAVAATTPAASPPTGQDQSAPPAAPAPSGSALTPTGQTSAEQTPSAAPELLEAARGIRLSLDRDPRLRELAVEVQPENGKLVLRGTVPDAQLIQAVEEIARRAAEGQPLQNELQAAAAR